MRKPSILALKCTFFGRNRLTKLYCICHSLLNISLYDPSAEAKLAPIFVTNTAINVTLMQQVTIHVLYSGSICTVDRQADQSFVQKIVQIFWQRKTHFCKKFQLYLDRIKYWNKTHPPYLFGINKLPMKCPESVTKRPSPT